MRFICILGIAFLAFGFSITTDGTIYIDGYGVVDSTDTVIIDRLPIQSSNYTITSYSNSYNFVLACDTFTCTGYDTVDIEYEKCKTLTIDTDSKISIFPNDTSSLRFEIEDKAIWRELDRYLGRLIIQSDDTSRIIINQLNSKMNLEIK